MTRQPRPILAAALLAVLPGCGAFSRSPSGLPFSPSRPPANESADLPPLTPNLLTLTVLSDGCAVARTTVEHEPSGIGWSVRDRDGAEVLQRNAVAETRYRYYQHGSFAVVLTAWDGSGYVPVSNTVAVRC